MEPCFQCGDCCKTLESVLITLEEYEILKEFGPPVVVAVKDRFEMQLPCIFQDGSRCTIWDVRPCMCRMWHCGKINPDDDIKEWISEIQDNMDNSEYRKMKTEMEDDAVTWGNSHGWNWRR